MLRQVHIANLFSFFNRRIAAESAVLIINFCSPLDLRIDVSLTHSNGGKFQEGAKSIAQSYCKTVGAETMKLRVHFSKFMDEVSFFLVRA